MEAAKIAEASRQPKDKNYNLTAVLYQSSDNVESLKTYIQDAEQEGSQELADFFSAVLENNLKAAQRVKEMLVDAGLSRSVLDHFAVHEPVATIG